MSNIVHQPATPLPWRYGDLSESIITDGGFPIADANQARDETGDDNVPLANLRYIAHAANAYPKLVDTLRELASWHRISRQSDIRNKQESLALARKADALLEKLGEAP